MLMLIMYRSSTLLDRQKELDGFFFIDESCESWLVGTFLYGRELVQWESFTLCHEWMNVMKNASTLCVLLYWPSTWFSHLTENFKVVISVGLIVLGAFIAGARDLSFDAYGYAVVFLSNITTAVYLATIARIGSTLTIYPFGKSFTAFPLISLTGF